MTFVEAWIVLRRHKVLAVYGLLVVLVLGTLSAYRLDGTTLVSRSAPVYETTAVVAVKAGPELRPAAPPSAVPADPNVVATTVPTPPLAPLDDVIDSRGLYYSALSLKTVVVSPGFSEAVARRAPNMDGSVTALVALDTNTISVVVDGSTPAIAAETMDASLAELQVAAASYAVSPASRFGLDGLVVSAPSTPSAVRSIKGPLTLVLVVAVGAVLVWVMICSVDQVQQHRRRTTRPFRPPTSDGERDAPAPLGSPNGVHHDTPVGAP
jgi:hypothetical protein